MDWNPTVREAYWQAEWESEGIFHSQIEMGRPKFYILEMYPYPSGKMHMGHVRNYSIGDAVARYKRARGFNVLYPMGFDSFGMPAENAAIAEQGHPRDITNRNMEAITVQFKRMGFSYDWRRIVMSHDPKYYRWNQWFFLRFLERGLAYRHHAPVNWCNDCDTVLANEQVMNGRCWRCSSEVVQKDMNQWFLKITDYSQELLDDLENINYPEHVKSLQRDWIGRSEGAMIRFPVITLPASSADTADKSGPVLEQPGGDDIVISAFTTRPDTIFGVTFLTLAPEHPLAEKMVVGSEYENQWRAMRDEVVAMSDFERGMLKQKIGVPTGHFATNPLTGEEVPIWIGNFVIASYGTGAVMAVPGHDQRDFDFAKNYDIPIRQVLVEKAGDEVGEMTSAYEGYGPMVASPVPGFDGKSGEEAKRAVIESLEGIGMGEGTVQWKIRDWLISRQRYWGTPIPIIHCPDCGIVPVPETQLPVLLPDDVEFTGHGNPLESSDDFCNVDCPTCGGKARRETDTMDTFVDSSWYFLRYCDAINHEMCFSGEVIDYWMNVDFYCGGIEHARMHLIYARFWTKALRDLGLHSHDEPFQTLLCQGMVNRPAPYCQPCGITHHVDLTGKACPACGAKLGMRSAKMSKSLGNTVSPEGLIGEYGADTVRLFILFSAQPEAGMDWSDEGVLAAWRQINLLHGIPATISEWAGTASPIDAWMDARTRQQLRRWMVAMDAADLRQAVEISHYELIKDLNWYIRRGGANPEVGQYLLEAWCYMLATATPHLAEEWWSCLADGGLNAARIMPHGFGEAEADDDGILAHEIYLRQFLEVARNTKRMAERHLEQAPTKAITQTTDDWKTDLALSALRFIADGGDVKQFQKVLIAKPYAQGEQKGAVITFWRKKMLPQVFKWSDEERALLLGGLDESSILRLNSKFICAELELQEFVVWKFGESEDEGGRGGYAFPLRPSLTFT